MFWYCASFTWKIIFDFTYTFRFTYRFGVLHILYLYFKLLHKRLYLIFHQNNLNKIYDLYCLDYYPILFMFHFLNQNTFNIELLLSLKIYFGFLLYPTVITLIGLIVGWSICLSISGKRHFSFFRFLS